MRWRAIKHYTELEDRFVYYKCDQAEFAKGYGQLFTEFENGAATRQINIFNNEMYASSSLTDWNEIIGFLLYDGHIDCLDVSESIRINRAEFENKWLEAISGDMSLK